MRTLQDCLPTEALHECGHLVLAALEHDLRAQSAPGFPRAFFAAGNEEPFGRYG